MNKYRAKKIVIDGIKFDSQKEGRRYLELKLLERAGKIMQIELQPVFPLIINTKPVLLRSDRYKNGRKAKYTADFRYLDRETGYRVIEDVKSKATRTEAYVLRKGIVEAIYGILIVEI